MRKAMRGMRLNQRGFTLIELLMSITLTAIIAGVLITTLSQMVTVSWAGNKHMQAIKQVENALFYINRDVQSAASISTTGVWLVINRRDGSSLSYSLITQPDGSVNLKRSQSGVNQVVARHIDTSPGLTQCSYANGLLRVRLTASLTGLGAASETRDLVIYPRLNQAAQ
jgi:prepilin-type N-terminal cleavage/methylation domain-containing protein